MFYIKKVGLKGKLGDSSLNLEKGLNVICGSSNTGKSIIVECIDYAFGDKECNIEIDGYDTIYLVLSHTKGEVKISRRLNEGNVTIQSSNNLIPSGTFPVRRKSKSDDVQFLDDFLLRLCDIPTEQKIVVSKEWKKQNFTFRTCLNSFIIKQENIIRRESPYLPLNTMAQGAYKSGLLYLWTGDSFDKDSKEDSKNWRIRRSAIEGYTSELLENVDKTYPDLEAKAKVDPKEMEEKIEETIKQISANQDLLHGYFEENKKLSNRLLEIDDELSENNNLLIKYRSLNSQYQADKKRLNLVIEGEENSSGMDRNIYCPFCNGKLEKTVQESCAEAAEKELLKLAPKIYDLNHVIQNIVSNIESLNSDREEISRSKKDVLSKINDEVKPLISKLQNDISCFKKAIEDSKEANILLSLKKQYETKIKELELQVRPEKDKNFVVMNYYSSIISKLENEYSRLLRLGNYEFNESPVFNNFDYVIDNKHKRPQGQGYRAYLNGLACLALYNSLWNNGVYPMSFLIMDSPIQSLVENSNIQINQSMRTGLFKCLKEAKAPKQIIVIENRLPEGLDYSDVNLVTFTKDEHTGRYGFVKNVK